MTWRGCNAWCERPDGITCPEESCDIADGLIEPDAPPASVLFRPAAECAMTAQFIAYHRHMREAIARAFG